MAFDPETCVTATVDLLKTTSVARVHAYRRLLLKLEHCHAHLFDAATQTFNGGFCTLRSISVDERDKTMGNGLATGASVLTEFAIQIELFATLDDAAASEVTFRQRVFEVCQAFNRRGKLVATASHQSAMTTETIGYLGLADTATLHYASLIYRLRGRTSP